VTAVLYQAQVNCLWKAHSQFINCKLTPLHCSICYSLPLPDPLATSSSHRQQYRMTQRTAQERIPGSVPVKCKRLFSLLECPHRLWDATSSLFNEHSHVISRGSSGWGVNLTTHQLAKLHEYICWVRACRNKTLSLLLMEI
jgi:hypothetical protein